jgi:hypothetical protein
MEMSGQLQTPAALPPGDKAPDAQCIACWIGSRVGMEYVGKRKYIASSGNRTPVVQLHRASYSDYIRNIWYR